MEIDTKMNLASINGLTPAKRSASSPPAQTPDGSFASSTALEDGLKSLPDARPEAVNYARSLIADPSYPSASTLNKLAGFLAGQLQAGFE
ncbi:MAG TPA: hypothetical protein VFC44_08395 [Candidatus Saccharimonadales bacterium]|nr:hypothetical protein [Candidatus Saccharimonadales bacterium]